MVNINDIDNVTVRKTNNGMYECSTVYKGLFRHHYYLGYTKAQALKMFKEAVAKGEL